MAVPGAASQAELECLTCGSEVARRWLKGTTPRRVMVVPGRLVNLVQQVFRSKNHLPPAQGVAFPWPLPPPRPQAECLLRLRANTTGLHL